MNKQKLNEFDKRLNIQDIFDRASNPYWFNFLIKLAELSKISSSIFNNKQIVNKIKNDPFTAKWEFELIQYFKENDIKIIDSETKISEGNNNLDFKINLINQDILVEANVQFLKEKEWNGGKAKFAPIDALIPIKVANKVKKNKIKNFKSPVVLAIDGTYSGLDSINLSSCKDKTIKECISGILLKTNCGLCFLKNENAKYQLNNEQINKLMGNQNE